MPPTRPRTGRWSGAARFLTASLTGGATWGQYARPYGEGYGAADIGGYSAADGCGGYGAARTAAAGLREPGAPQGPRRGQDGRCGGYGAPSRPRTALRRLRGSSAARTGAAGLQRGHGGIEGHDAALASLRGIRATTRPGRPGGLQRGQDAATAANAALAGVSGYHAARTARRAPARLWRAPRATARPRTVIAALAGVSGYHAAPTPLPGIHRCPASPRLPHSYSAAVMTTEAALLTLHAAHSRLVGGQKPPLTCGGAIVGGPVGGLWAAKTPSDLRRGGCGRFLEARKRKNTAV